MTNPPPNRRIIPSSATLAVLLLPPLALAAAVEESGESPSTISSSSSSPGSILGTFSLRHDRQQQHESHDDVQLYYPLAPPSNGTGNHTGNHTDTGGGGGSEEAQDIMGYTLLGVLALMVLWALWTFKRDMWQCCLAGCSSFRRHGCGGCVRSMLGRGGGSEGEDGGGGGAGADAAGGTQSPTRGTLNEIIFDPDDGGDAADRSGTDNDLTRGLLTDEERTDA